MEIISSFNQQPLLKDNLIFLRPLQQNDFDLLYSVASDPLIWEQHPNRDRYKREVFKIFFEGALQSKGAFIILDKATGSVIGSSRFYDASETSKTIMIGYTFLSHACWGKGYNTALKRVMLNHAFTCFDKVLFHVGAGNIRSQKAIERLGARKTGEIQVEYYGEPEKLNYVYEIKKSNWI